MILLLATPPAIPYPIINKAPAEMPLGVDLSLLLLQPRGHPNLLSAFKGLLGDSLEFGIINIYIISIHHRPS